MPCTTVTNFCNEGKVMVLLRMVRYQVLLCFRHVAIVAIKHVAINVSKNVKYLRIPIISSNSL